MSETPVHYNLPTESIPTLDYSVRLADLIEFKCFLEAHGIATQNTRIERYIQYFKQVVAGVDVAEVSIFKNSQDERFKSKTDWLLYALVMVIINGSSRSKELFRLFVFKPIVQITDRTSERRDVTCRLLLGKPAMAKLIFCLASHFYDHVRSFAALTSRLGSLCRLRTRV